MTSNRNLQMQMRSMGMPGPDGGVPAEVIG